MAPYDCKAYEMLIYVNQVPKITYLFLWNIQKLHHSIQTQTLLSSDSEFPGYWRPWQTIKPYE